MNEELRTKIIGEISAILDTYHFHEVNATDTHESAFYMGGQSAIDEVFGVLADLLPEGMDEADSGNQPHPSQP